MQHRIIRGFHRLGIGAAVLVMLVGSGFTSWSSINQYGQHNWPGQVVYDPVVDEVFKAGPHGNKRQG